MTQEILKYEKHLNYEKTKNIYIPSERNFVASIPNLKRYNETNDNILSFLYDWYSAKKNYSKTKPLDILDLGIKFYSDFKKDNDYIILNDNEVQISLNNSSSGIQSLTPLLVVVEYLTSIIYRKRNVSSVQEMENFAKILAHNSKLLLGHSFDVKDESQFKQFIKNPNAEKVFELSYLRAHYFKTNLIIEEPEQNLFPTTQRDLIYFILSRINGEKEHGLTITTHSPYILYALNNCLLGYQIDSKVKKKDKKLFKSQKAWISPDKINMFEINNGGIKDIMDDQSKTLGKNYFNENMNEILNEYYSMLSYYEPPK